MTHDLGDFYSTAATLTPVLLLVCVASLRRAVAPARAWVKSTVLLVIGLPFTLSEVQSLSTLAFGGRGVPTLVFWLLIAQLFITWGCVCAAFYDPGSHDLS